MNPAFSPSRMHGVVMPHFLKYSKRFAAKMSAIPSGSRVDILHELQRLTLDIICSAGFGFDLNAIEVQSLYNNFIILSNENND